MRYKHILFDLDGTLVESAPGIIASAHHALEEMGLDTACADLRFIGPPLIESFQHLCSLDPQTAAKTLKLYREYYSSEGMFQANLYGGVTDLLNRLDNSGRKLYLATSKVQDYAVQVLEHFGIARHFTFIGGADFDETRNSKAKVIAHVFQNTGLEPGDGVIMVGDRKHDVIGAHHFSIPCAGVLYGYGSRHELQEAGADYIFEDINTLGAHLLE